MAQYSPAEEIKSLESVEELLKSLDSEFDFTFPDENESIDDDHFQDDLIFLRLVSGVHKSPTAEDLLIHLEENKPIKKILIINNLSYLGNKVALHLLTENHIVYGINDISLAGQYKTLDLYHRTEKYLKRLHRQPNYVHMYIKISDLNLKSMHFNPDLVIYFPSDADQDNTNPHIERDLHILALYKNNKIILNVHPQDMDYVNQNLSSQLVIIKLYNLYNHLIVHEMIQKAVRNESYNMAQTSNNNSKNIVVDQYWDINHFVNIFKILASNWTSIKNKPDCLILKPYSDVKLSRLQVYNIVVRKLRLLKIVTAGSFTMVTISAEHPSLMSHPDVDEHGFGCQHDIEIIIDNAITEYFLI